MHLLARRPRLSSGGGGPPAFNWASGGKGSTASFTSGVGSVSGLGLGGVSASSYRRVYALVTMDLTTDLDTVTIQAGSNTTIGGVEATVHESGNEGFVASGIISALVPTGTTADVSVEWGTDTGNEDTMVVRLVVLEGELTQTDVTSTNGDYVNGQPSVTTPNPGLSLHAGAAESQSAPSTGTGITILDNRLTLGSRGTYVNAVGEDGNGGSILNGGGGGDECGSAVSITA